MSLERNPTDRYQTFEDWFNEQPEMGATGQGWSIQLWKKKNNGDLAPLTQHSNHLGVEGYVNGSNIVKLSTDFLADRSPIIISKFFFSIHDINPGLSKVYWYVPAYAGTETESNPFELKRAQLYFMYKRQTPLLDEPDIWRVIQPTQMPGFLANVNAGNAVATGHGHDWMNNRPIDGGDLMINPNILNGAVTDNYLKWIGIIAAVILVLMLLVKFIF